jgi:hypothetical protein
MIFSMDEFLLLKNKRPYPTKDKTKVYTPPVYMLTNMSFPDNGRMPSAPTEPSGRPPEPIQNAQPAALPPSGPLSEGRRHPYYFSICGLTYYGFTIASLLPKVKRKRA